MGLFGNQPSQNAPPVDAVAQLRSQQRSDHEIIDELSKQGYSSIDIYNALNQADQGPPSQGQAPQGQDPQGQDPYAQQNQFSQDPNAQQYAPDAQPDPFANQADQYAPPQEQSQQEQYGQSQAPPSQASQAQSQPSQSSDPWQNQSDDPWSANIVHAQPSQQSPPPSQPAPSQQPQPAPSQPPSQSSPPSFTPQRSQERSYGSTFGGSDATIDQIDQVAEAIIDEKWKEMKAYIEKIVDWKGKVENRIIAVEENQKMLNEQIVGLQKTMLDKVQTYDRHITDVGTEIKAMEKVFQKIIPSLTENVNELSSVVHRMKDDQ